MRRETASFILGLVVGVLVGSYIGIGLPVPLLWGTVGAAFLAFVAGVVAGRGAGTTCRPRMGGRVFRYPHGPALVEIALRRTGRR